MDRGQRLDQSRKFSTTVVEPCGISRVWSESSGDTAISVNYLRYIFSTIVVATKKGLIALIHGQHTRDETQLRTV